VLQQAAGSTRARRSRLAGRHAGRHEGRHQLSARLAWLTRARPACRWRLARKQARQAGHSLPRHWTREYADYQSVWTKYPQLPFALNVLAVAVMVMFFVILPLYISRGKLVDLSCP
jgi:hypothetical protein